MGNVPINTIFTIGRRCHAHPFPSPLRRGCRMPSVRVAASVRHRTSGHQPIFVANPSSKAAASGGPAQLQHSSNLQCHPPVIEHREAKTSASHNSLARGSRARMASRCGSDVSAVATINLSRRRTSGSRYAGAEFCRQDVLTGVPVCRADMPSRGVHMIKIMNQRRKDQKVALLRIDPALAASIAAAIIMGK